MAIERLSDILRPESVLAPVRAKTRDGAIAELVGALSLPGTPADAKALVDAMVAREQAGSTGIGNGVAIPHARSSRLGTSFLAVGLSPRRIDFGSADGKLVSLVFLLAVPESPPGAHLKILAALSRISSDKKMLRSLNASADARELYDRLASIAV